MSAARCGTTSVNESGMSPHACLAAHQSKRLGCRCCRERRPAVRTRAACKLPAPIQSICGLCLLISSPPDLVQCCLHLPTSTRPWQV